MVGYNIIKIIMDTKQRFKVYCSNLEKNFPLSDGSDELILEAVASTSSLDEEGDMITNECIESMKNQALGLNIHLDHNHDTHNVIGNVIEVLETDNKTLKIKFKILPSWQSKILEYLDNGIALGLSIGGAVKDFEETESGWEIKDIKLYEISLTPLPANWDTFGTVKVSSEEELVTAKCFDGACKQVLTNLKSLDITKDVEDGEDPDEDDKITEEEVINIINQFGIELKNQIIAEIVSEFNLDGKKYDNNTEESSESDDNTKDSSDEDKEKNLDMEKEEIKELIVETIKEVNKELVVEAIKEMKEAEATEETPVVEEEVVDVVKAQCDDEDDEDDKDKEKSSEDADEEDKKEKSVEEPVAEEEPVVDKETLMKELREELVLELKPQIRKEVEEEILKELSELREPEETPQPTVEKEQEEEETIKKGAMSTRDLAKHLINN